jgi:hypothetical protein
MARVASAQGSHLGEMAYLPWESARELTTPRRAKETSFTRLFYRDARTFCCAELKSPAPDDIETYPSCEAVRRLALH